MLWHGAAAAAVRDEQEVVTPTAEEGDWGVSSVAAAVEQLTADLSRLHALLPELNLLDKCALFGNLLS
jgi:hypothetical protein